MVDQSIEFGFFFFLGFFFFEKRKRTRLSVVDIPSEGAHELTNWIDELGDLRILVE